MNQPDLIEAIAMRMPNKSVSEITYATNLMLNLIKDTLEKHERVEVRGFGSFQVRHRSPRTARNPKSGVSVDVGAKVVVHFKPGKEMKERVNATYLIEIEQAKLKNNG